MGLDRNGEILSQIYLESLQRGRGRRNLGRTEFPEDLAEDAGRQFGVRSGKVQAVYEAADFLFGGGGRAPLRGYAGTRFQIAAGAEGVEQERGEALEISSGGRDMPLWFHGGFWTAREFVKAHGYSLAKVHGAMFFARGNSQEPMAVAEVFIRETTLLRTEKQRDAATGKMPAKKMGSLIQAADPVLQLTVAHCGRSDDE